MLARPEPAFLLIADISGYTGYLAGAELDHAQDILADLVTTVVKALRPPFKLSKLEGDAAFVHALGASIDASMLLDAVDGTYFAFRRRLRDIKESTSCPCNACVLMPRLDLKLVAHHGSVIRQRVAGRDELLGSDVIVAHRLLKNGVIESGGPAAYALFTDACLAAIGADPVALGFAARTESYEDIGEVGVQVHDLHAAWGREASRARRIVERSEYHVRRVLPVPQPVAWQYVTSPGERPRWQVGVTGVIEGTAAGRRGIGTTNHCMHGRDAVVEEILDWEPYDHVTVRSTLPIPNAPKLVSSIVFEPADDGTAVEFRFEEPRGREARAFFRASAEGYGKMFGASLESLAEQLREARADAEPRIDDEPPLPASAGRFASEPIAAAGSATEVPPG